MFLLSAPASVEGWGWPVGRNMWSYSEAVGKGLRGPQAQEWDKHQSLEAHT